MDIFTTALTRVVPVPIKPANLKVKALLKEAAIGELKEDHDHLENHEYITPKKNGSKQPQQKDQNQQQTSQQTLAQDIVDIEPSKDDEHTEHKEPNINHQALLDAESDESALVDNKNMKGKSLDIYI